MNYFRSFFLVFMILGISKLAVAQEKYAVLITGDYAGDAYSVPISDQWNDGQGKGLRGFDEFWNDTFLMWEMLTKPIDEGGKGYSEENVYVLFAGGQDYYKSQPGVDGRYRPDDGSTVVTDYSASMGNLSLVFNGLASGTGGLPQLNQDDFLFVWTFDHGGGSGGNSTLCLIDGNITDDAFAALVNPIQANKKVFWMQQCRSGGFVDELEGNTTFFHSACQANQNAYRANDTPDIENEIRNNVTYHHGEYNFHMYSVTNGESPEEGTTSYNGIPYSSADLNSDNCISVSESWLWESARENSPETPLYSDLGSIGSTTSLRFPTLMFEDITSSENHRGIIGVTKDVRVMPGQTLTLYDKAIVHFINDAKITVEAGASLVIGDNVEFIMDDPHGTSDPSHSALLVRGNISFGSDIKFSSKNGHDWKGLDFDAMTTSYTLQGIEFDHCGIYGSARLTVSNS